MNECQELNPEPEEDASGKSSLIYSICNLEGDEFEGMEDEEYNNGEGDHDPGYFEAPESAQWFTAETPDDEIQLSEQGRANLARMLGNLDENPESKIYYSYLLNLPN